MRFTAANFGKTKRVRSGLESPVINADVLDAWFSPPDAILEALKADCGWYARTSPPTHSEGVTATVAAARGVATESVLLGPGSSSLMFLAWSQLVKPSSKVLLVEPTYGEYRYLTESVVGAQVQTFLTSAANGFVLDLDAWLETIHRDRPDVVVLVNPNNPTGSLIDMRLLIDSIPDETLVWIDEAYIDYAGGASMEAIAASRPNTIVLKSMSKAYALSGVRAAYIVSHPSTIAKLKRWVPPWWLGLPAQIAATLVWEHLDYYAQCHLETRELRRAFERRLADLPFELVASEANWVLLRVPARVSADWLVNHARSQGIFLRNAGASATSLGDEFVRIAVKPELEQVRIIRSLRDAVAELGSRVS